MYEKRLSLLLAVLLLGGCGVTPSNDAHTAIPNTNADGKVAGYTMSDVAAHASSSDCWIIVGNQVYDVTDYITQHPGGNAITSGCGQDATSMMGGIEGGRGHSTAAYSMISEYYIGELQ